MPKVGKKHFPYTSAGKKAAASMKSGIKAGMKSGYSGAVSAPMPVGGVRYTTKKK
jgi:hypothetical protein